MLIWLTAEFFLVTVVTQIAQQTLAVEDNDVAAAMLVEVQRKGGNLFKAVQIAGAGAANTILVGGTLICSATLGSNLEAQYSHYAKNIISVDISEFHKVDGGLTCLSIIIEHWGASWFIYSHIVLSTAQFGKLRGPMGVDAIAYFKVPN
jgi:hypothetical protein